MSYEEEYNDLMLDEVHSEIYNTVCPSKLNKAKNLIKNYFSVYGEAQSWAVDTGVFTLEDTKSFDDETLILIAEDLSYQVRSSE